MSMPNFPEFNPDITREHALDMILASIAMEELAFSHIINAEGEKLQYILGTLETSSAKAPNIHEVLCVNQSVSDLLEVISQNQILLKNKMDKVLQALPHECPCPICPPGPQGPAGPKGDAGPQGERGPAGSAYSRCNAFFRGVQDCPLWNTGCALPWNCGTIQGKCVCLHPNHNTKVLLCSKGRFMINFAVNVHTQSLAHCDVAVSLQMLNAQRCSEIFTVKQHIPCANTAVTISMSGILVDNFYYCGPSALSLTLVSPDPLLVEDAMLSIIEI